MKKKLEPILIYVDGTIVLLGLGLIVANVIHLALHGDLQEDETALAPSFLTLRFL
jgi:hypothetical protein